MPNDFSYWETIDELVQQEPVGAGDPEILGQLAAVGIRKGQPFAPDERMRGILEEDRRRADGRTEELAWPTTRRSPGAQASPRCANASPYCGLG
jgi:hypothetical protein